jgi:hypothetical protein
LLILVSIHLRNRHQDPQPNKMKKFKKFILIVLSCVIIIGAVGLFYISRFTKYIIENQDEKFTGREITMESAFTNPFTGLVQLKNVNIYELHSDSIFLSAKQLSINFAMLKLLFKTYEISSITLDHPRGVLSQNKDKLNIDDLITRFSPGNATDSMKAPVHFSILDIKINDGEFLYREDIIPINYSIKEANFESTGKFWDADTIRSTFSFIQGIGTGRIDGDFTINVKNKDYRLAAIVRKFDLNIIQQYLKDLSNYGRFTGNLDADIRAIGNFKDQQDLTAKGRIAINDFHFGKSTADDYASFEQFAVTFLELSPKKQRYFCDSVSLRNSYFKFELYDSLDNYQTMFGKDGSKIAAVSANPAKFNLVIELGRYIKDISKNFFKSDYKINHLAVTNGNVKFSDFSVSEKFTVSLSPLNITADSVNKDHSYVNVLIHSMIKPYGNLTVNLKLNPKDTGEFDMHYHLQNVSAAMFNPYTVSFTSFPMDRGSIEIKGTWHVRDGNIKSNNHLILLDPRHTRQLRNKDSRWIPLPLILTLFRERGNVIDYEIPIVGNMRDPAFKLSDVVFDLIKNIFIKPATTPYGLQVRVVEAEIEKTLNLKWAMRNSIILPEQERFIEKIADFLKKHPEESITIHPQQYAVKEKEYILFYEAKKRFFLQSPINDTKPLSDDDAAFVDKLSVKSDSFQEYINKHVIDSLIFTIQGKCASLIDSAFVNAKYNQLTSARKGAFIAYFKARNVENQVKFAPGENVVPYNGFSFYKIHYNGIFPDALIRAYRQMHEFNDHAPRRKFRKIRKESIVQVSE